MKGVPKKNDSVMQPNRIIVVCFFLFLCNRSECFKIDDFFMQNSGKSKSAQFQKELKDLIDIDVTYEYSEIVYSESDRILYVVNLIKLPLGMIEILIFLYSSSIL